MLCCSLGLYPLYANKVIKYLVKQTNHLLLNMSHHSQSLVTLYLMLINFLPVCSFPGFIYYLLIVIVLCIIDLLYMSKTVNILVVQDTRLNMVLTKYKMCAMRTVNSVKVSKLHQCLHCIMVPCNFISLLFAVLLSQQSMHIQI